jgi:rRNA maturation protein Nop10
MIRNLKDDERIGIVDGRKALIDKNTNKGKYFLSDTCVCGKPTNYNRFWTNCGEQLCRECTLFTIRGEMEDAGWTIYD